jgi:YD repeat-containing protein
VGLAQRYTEPSLKTDANGNKTNYVYDSAGRQTEVIAPDGSSTKSDYDQYGNLVASTDALGKVTHYEYDPLGRQTATISPTGERTETTYDAAGHLTDISGCPAPRYLVHLLCRCFPH